MTDAEAIQERRNHDIQWKDSVDWHMRTTTEQVAQLTGKVDANTVLTATTAGKVEEVHEILTGFKAGAKAIKWGGSVCVGLTGIIGFGIAIFHLVGK